MRKKFTALEIAERLGKVARSGGGYKCCCPAHNDNNPSLYVWDNSSGPGFKCYAGCTNEEIRSRLIDMGLFWHHSASKEQGAGAAPNYKKLIGWIPDAVHIYRDATGNEVFRVVRRNRPGGGKDIRPLVRINGRSPTWRARSANSPRPLYNLDRLSHDRSTPVLLVEGEKTADAAAKLFADYVVTTFPGGANSVEKVDVAPLKGRRVTLWPDNDAAGIKAMKRLAERAATAGAETCALVELPQSLPEKWDLADPVPDGISVTEILNSACGNPRLVDQIRTAQELVAMDIPPREFIIAPFLPVGSLSMVYAARGLGKTWFSLELSRTVSQGESFFGFDVPKPRCVLYIDGEMTLVELRERLNLLGVELTGENFCLLPSELLALHDRPLNINDPEDQAAIIKAIQTLESRGRRPDLVIFDNLSSLAGGVDENDNTALDALLQWLVNLRHKGLAILLVHHTGKSGDQRGASRREDLLDTSIRLSADEDEASQSGASFVVSFAKTRGRTPKPKEFRLRLVEVTGGCVEWQLDGSPRASARDQALRAIAENAPRTQNELAAILGRSKGAISQHCSALKRLGLLDGLAPTTAGWARVIELWPELNLQSRFPDELI
ncbi:MAG TPA: AAA family ATPase [Xanthobacteraceae bacterium]|nr:AAA family ATPase [Xanthobacteraceae bacterium]